MSMDGYAEASMEASAMDTGAELEPGADAYEEPSYWRMSGTLLVNEGQIQSELSFLQVSIIGDAGSELCLDSIGIASSSRQGESPEPGVQAWWRVMRTEPESGSCLAEEYSMPLPKPVYVGLGAMHPEILAVLAGETDRDSVEGSRMRSVYASMGAAADVWVFGVAETTSEEEVEIDPSTGGVSVDGNWKFEGLYSFPLVD